MNEPLNEQDLVWIEIGRPYCLAVVLESHRLLASRLAAAQEERGKKKFRKKPVVIEAVKFDRNIAEITTWIGGENGERFLARPPDEVGILTLGGTMWASRGDWIIKGVRGEFYPCKPDIFEVAYEPVIDGQDQRETEKTVS